MRKAFVSIVAACSLLLPVSSQAASPFGTQDTFTIDKFEAKGSIEIKLVAGCSGGSGSSGGGQSGQGQSGQQSGQQTQTNESDGTIFKSTLEKGTTIGPFMFHASENDCLAITVAPNSAGKYGINSVTVRRGDRSYPVLDGNVSGGLDELVMAGGEDVRKVVEEVRTEGVDPGVCSHPEWFDKLPEGCNKIKDALKNVPAPVSLNLPLYKLTRAVNIIPGGVLQFTATDSDGHYSVNLLMKESDDKTKGVSLMRSEGVHALWTARALEKQTVIIDGKTYELEKGGTVAGRFQGDTQIIEAKETDHTITFFFAKDDMLSLWAKIPGGEMISWGERSWNTLPTMPAVPFQVKAGNVTLQKPDDPGQNRALSAGAYDILFLSDGVTYKASYTMKDSFGSDSFSDPDIKSSYGITFEEKADINYVNLVAHFFPQKDKAGTIGDKCYLVPAGTGPATGLSVYRNSETVATTYFILAAFCEEGASVPKMDRVVVSIVTPSGDSVLDLKREDLGDLVVFWNKRVWNVGDSFEYAVLMGAQGDRAEIFSDKYTINPVAGVGQPSSGYEPVGFKRHYQIDTGEQVLQLEFSYDVERRNGYPGGFRGYVFINHDDDDTFDDIRQMVAESKGDKVVLKLTVPFVAEEKEQKVKFAVAIYDDTGEMIPSLPDGRTHLTMTIPPRGSRALAPMVFAIWDKNRKTVNTGFSIADGPALELSNLSLHFGIHKHGRGVVYLTGTGLDVPASATKQPIRVDALNYREGEVYAEFRINNVDLSDFWGFRYVGDYLAVLEVENKSAVSGSNMETTMQEIADFHIR